MELIWVANWPEHAFKTLRFHNKSLVRFSWVKKSDLNHIFFSGVNCGNLEDRVRQYRRSEVSNPLKAPDFNAAGII